jgi:hypothetical protein
MSRRLSTQSPGALNIFYLIMYSQLHDVSNATFFHNKDIPHDH